MGFSRSLTGKLYVISLLSLNTFAAPAAVRTPTAEVNKPSNRTDVLFDDFKLLKRATQGNSQQTPAQVTFNINGWPDIAELNCYAMLCLENGNRIYQRASTDHYSVTAYRESGAALGPFNIGQQQYRHTEQINNETTSAEEFPWRSVQIAPNGNRYLFPATDAEQRSQGGSITQGYNSGGVTFDDWFEITFAPSTSFGIYCRALFQNPPDFSVCTKVEEQEMFGTQGVEAGNFAFLKQGQGLPHVFEHAGPKPFSKKLKE